MELRIDFYSKTEVATQVEFAVSDPFPENEASELFLFSCYALRQLSNLGNHDVAKVLALLMSAITKSKAIELADGTYEFPDSEGLGLLMGFHGVHFNIDYNIISNQLFSPIPNLVRYRGAGKKYFLMSLPPLHLSTKGFGLLGSRMNYYAFHSVIALLTFFAKKHKNDDVYLNHLAAMVEHCGLAFFAGVIPEGDQIQLANGILKNIGVNL